MVVDELESLARIKGETAAGNQFEKLMESVEVDVRWVSASIAKLSQSASSPQRREFERQIALHLRSRCTERTKAVQRCAELRQESLSAQQKRRDKYMATASHAVVSVALDAPYLQAAYKPLTANNLTQNGWQPTRKYNSQESPSKNQKQMTSPAPIGSTFGLRARKPITETPNVWDPSTVNNSRLQLQQHHEQQQQRILLEHTARERLTRAHDIEKQVSNLGALFSRFSTLIAEQAEVVVRLDEETGETLMQVEQGRAELSKAEKIIRGNRSLIIKVFVILILFIIYFLRF
mmetsp:Transcript_6310/g.8855  ORF Transcript_6310/g.8855 Transcript_6310/m.8855 type:complete len:291 (-) Transcript_6310:129-1001(-)